MITKHPGTGGQVTVETVTAQLLYEIGPPAYANPDVVARFDTIRLDEVGPDRVRISGTRGEPAPSTTKVAINYDGGFRNRMTFVLTGLDQQAKASWLERAIVDNMGGAAGWTRRSTMETRFVPVPSDGPDQERSSGLLHVAVKAPDERTVGRAFSSAAIELALANYPGFFATGPPGAAQRRTACTGRRWCRPTRSTRSSCSTTGRGCRVDPAPTGPPADVADRGAGFDAEAALGRPWHPAGRPLRRPLRRQGRQRQPRRLGADDAGYAWLDANLTVERLRELLPEAAELEVRRYELANLRALNFVLVGYLGEGVASSTSFDPQAKGLGEYLRSRRA